MNLKSLTLAVQSLDLALVQHQKNSDDAVRDVIRDGCIQRFEYCYELCFRMMRRYLKEESSNPSSIDALGFKDIIRMALGKKIIGQDLEMWIKYRDCRNKTSHHYDQKSAQEIFQIIPDFLSQAQYLIEQLSKRMESS